MMIAWHRSTFLLVMPMMRMLFKESTPSILDSSWFTILSDTPVESCPSQPYMT